MLIKCKGCGSLIDRNTAYKNIHIAKSGTKTNEYYCDEAEYSKIQKEKDLKNSIRNLLFEILELATLNTQLSKEMAIIYKTYNIDNIYGYLKDNVDFLNGTLARHNFKSEYHKIRYLMAILKNQINNYKEEKQVEIKAIPFEYYESNYKPKPRRKSIGDYERGYDECF